MSELVQQSEAYKNFINSVDSEETKKIYQYCLSRFMTFCKMQEYDNLLTIEPKKLEALIRDYIINLKASKLSSNSVNLYFAAVSHFYQMNDVILNWKKLGKFKGKKRLLGEDKPYTKDQIRHLLDFADLRMKCIILLVSSSGLRKGAIPLLRVGHLKLIEKYNLYKISVYKNEKEEYTTYCSPECTTIIDQYLEWRERQGEVITPKSPVIRKQFQSIDAAKPKPIKPGTMVYLITNLLEKSGVRLKSENQYKRTELMQWHGFRKYFETSAKNAGMDTLILKRLMGQKTGLEDAYYKPSDDQILEGNDKMIGFAGVINELTVNEEFKLKKRVEELTRNKNEIELMESKHNEEIKAMREDMNQIMSLIRQNPKLAKVKPEVLVKKKI